jgi:protoheme IX farnesyltransferase
MLGDLIALTKPRLAFFSVLSAMAAYGAAEAGTDACHALATLSGTTLAAAGALSLNQWWERDLDRLMHRTCGRPLPRAAIPARVALVWSLALGVSGIGVLAIWINFTAAAVAAATILLYGLVYTPLKRRTRWATEVGAIAGALPPLIGGAAAASLDAPTAWILFAVLLCWQMPHFFAIGWMHRDEYRIAGFPLLPAIDPTGRRTAAWSLAYALLLLPVSLAPWALQVTGALYGVSALVAGSGFVWRAVQFARANADRDIAARRLFLASILYLPIVMAALLLDRAL